MGIQIAQSNLTPKVPSLFYSPGFDREFIIRFFMYFARAEYALKRTGYLRGNEEKAEADWNRFASSVEHKFNPDISQELSSAVEYLQNHPPKKQTVKNGKLDWAEARPDDRSLIHHLLTLVRIVRNNLFHGGKFPLPIAELPELSRDKILLESSLIVLGEAIRLNTRVEKFFSEEIH